MPHYKGVLAALFLARPMQHASETLLHTKTQWMPTPNTDPKLIVCDSTPRPLESLGRRENRAHENATEVDEAVTRRPSASRSAARTARRTSRTRLPASTPWSRRA